MVNSNELLVWLPRTFTFDENTFQSTTTICVTHEKVGLEKKAKLIFQQADDDGSGELSLVECFAMLPSIEIMMKKELKPLPDGVEESCDEQFSESEEEDEFENPAKASGGFFSGVSFFGKKDGKPTRSNDLLTHFRSMDSDGSGFVDQLELRTVFKLMMVLNDTEKSLVDRLLIADLMQFLFQKP